MAAGARRDRGLLSLSRATGGDQCTRRRASLLSCSLVCREPLDAERLPLLCVVWYQPILRWRSGWCVLFMHSVFPVVLSLTLLLCSIPISETSREPLGATSHKD